MQSTKSSHFVQIVTPFVKLAIGLVALLILRYIVSIIPMIKDAEIARLPVTPLQILFAVIDTVILVALLNSGRELKNALQASLPEYTQVGTVANLVVMLIVICIAYAAYGNIAGAVLSRKYHWLYSLAFLGIALIPLYLLGSTVYRNVDLFTESVVGMFRKRAEEGPTCPTCNATVAGDAKFCKECGTQLGQPTKAAEEGM